MKLNLRRTASLDRWQPLVLTILLCLVASVLWMGCRIVKTTVSVPKKTITAIFPGGKSEQPEPGDLQQSLMRFADAYAERTVEMVDELTGVPGSPFDTERALLFKISTTEGVITIAAGENTYADLLDMVSLATLTRMVLEDYWVTTPHGELFEPWLRHSRAMETNIWTIADQVLAVEQQDELRQSIQEHYASLTHLKGLFLMHPQDLLVPRSLAKKKGDGSVFKLAALDPMSGLDPAVREVTETRLFAARALYLLGRQSWLVRWQSELLVLRVTDQPKVAQALEDATSLSESIDRASKAADTVSQTAAQLPAQIADERKAIVEALAAQEGQITTLLQSGTEFSDSLGTTLTNFDALMKRFGVGEADTHAAPPDPNAKPFDILDYAKTAEQVAAMAKELNETINGVNTTLDSPALDRLSNQATADGRSLLNHLFLLASGLVVLVLVCALIYRAATHLKGKR